MKKPNLFFTFCILTIQFSFGQELKIDPRTPLEKENPMKIYNPEQTTMLDLLEAIEFQGIRINKFELGKFDKNYNVLLLSDKYYQGKFVKTDTLSRFKSTYHYYESDKLYLDFISNIKIITKDSGNKSKLYIKTYSFSSRRS